MNLERKPRLLSLDIFRGMTIAGMILVNDTGNHPGQPDELIRFGALAGPEEMKIAALQVKA